MYEDRFLSSYESYVWPARIAFWMQSIPWIAKLTKRSP